MDQMNLEGVQEAAVSLDDYRHDTTREDRVIEEALSILERRLKARRQEECVVSGPKDMERFIRLKLAQEEREVFAVTFLDTRHRVIAFEEVFYGTVDGSAVQPREIIKRALAHNAAALVVAHNHPSGVTEPSSADQILTGRIKEACDLMGVRLIDHFVVGEGEAVSFARRGLL